MSPEFIIKLGQESLTLILYVGGPILIVALVVGLAVSIFQAVTQVHEMTLTFIPKIIAVGMTLILILPWMMQRMIDFTTNLLLAIPTLIGDALGASPDVPVPEDLQKTLAYVTQMAPTFSLRGGTREILRGSIARGLDLR